MKATVESVLRQRFSDFELIVIDDGSTDNTINFLQKNYADNEKMHLFSKENEERGAARNYGFKNATGKYVCFLDSDDIWKPDHLEKLHQYIQVKYFPTLIATKYFWVRNNRRIPCDLKEYPEGFYDKNIVIKGNPFSCNFTVNREADIALFPEERSLSTMEDWIFLIQNLQHHQIYLVDEYTIDMVDHEDRSVTNNLSVIHARRKAVEYIEKNIRLEKDELKLVKGYSHLYEAIHFYLAGSRGSGLSSWFKAMNLGAGGGKSFGVLARLLLGRKWVNNLAKLKG